VLVLDNAVVQDQWELSVIYALPLLKAGVEMSIGRSLPTHNVLV